MKLHLIASKFTSVFIDFADAFGSINHQFLFETLQYFDITDIPDICNCLIEEAVYFLPLHFTTLNRSHFKEAPSFKVLAILISWKDLLSPEVLRLDMSSIVVEGIRTVFFLRKMF